MKTGDILALTNNSSAAQRRAFERRSGMAGAVLAAAIVIMGLAGAYSARSAQAVLSDADEIRAPTTVERGGALSILEVLY